MYCNQCGAPIPGDAKVCSACGNPIPGAAAPAPTAAPAATAYTVALERISNHRTILGVLWIIYGAVFHLFPALMLLFFKGMILTIIASQGDAQAAHAAPIVGGVLGIVGGILLFFGLAYLIAGIGLLQRQSWGRIFTLIVGFVSLINIPFGTGLGIYTIWVLLSGNAEQAWERICAS